MQSLWTAFEIFSMFLFKSGITGVAPDRAEITKLMGIQLLATALRLEDHKLLATTAMALARILQDGRSKGMAPSCTRLIFLSSPSSRRSRAILRGKRTPTHVSIAWLHE